MSRRTKAKGDADDDDDESVPGPSTSKTAAASKARSKAVRVGGGGERREPKRAAKAQDDAYKFIDLSAGESPCLSDGEGARENTRGKVKAKMGQTDTTKRKAATTNTIKVFFNTTEPSTMRVTKPSTLNPVASMRVYEEEEDSVDTAVPLPLSKSSRPLDLLRAKARPGTAPPNPTSKSKSKSKSTAVSRHEEEESPSSSSPNRPSGSKPSASSLPCQPAQPARQATKKPLVVDASDTDSDIEASDVRRPLFGTIATITTHEAEGKPGVGDGDVVSLDVLIGTRSARS